MLLVWARLRPRPSTQRDVADLLAWAVLTVAAFHRPIGQCRWRPGLLRLQPDRPQPIVWTAYQPIHPWTAEPQQLPAPLAVYSVRPASTTDAGLKPGLFSVVDLTTAGHPFPLAVPTRDTGLVRQAIAMITAL